MKVTITRTGGWDPNNPRANPDPTLELTDAGLDDVEAYLDGENTTSINANTARVLLDEVRRLRSQVARLTEERDAARAALEYEKSHPFERLKVMGFEVKQTDDSTIERDIVKSIVAWLESNIFVQPSREAEWSRHLAQQISARRWRL